MTHANIYIYYKLMSPKPHYNTHVEIQDGKKLSSTKGPLAGMEPTPLNCNALSTTELFRCIKKKAKCHLPSRSLFSNDWILWDLLRSRGKLFQATAPP